MFAGDPGRRFGLSPEEADARWPARMAIEAKNEVQGVPISARKYAVGSWLMTVYFFDGKSGAFDYQKRQGGSAVAPTDLELDAILHLFELTVNSETLAIYRLDPDQRQWGSDNVAQYDPRSLTLRVFSKDALEKIRKAAERQAQHGTAGL